MAGDRARSVGILGTVLVVGIALRTQVAGVAPLIPRVRDAFDLPFVLAGWLTSAPVFFLGAMAFAGPWVARSLGTRNAIAWSMAIVILFSLWRVASADAATLLLTTLPLGMATGLAGALIPAAVRYLDHRLRGPALGFFTLGLQAGTGGAAAVAIPLALWLGGWRQALVALALPLVIALLIWIGTWRTSGDDRSSGSNILPRTTFPLVSVFGFQAFVFHSTLTWLPARLTEVGWSESAAGATFGLLNTLAMVGTLLVAIWCRTFAARVRLTFWASVALAAGLTLVGLDPQRTIAWACVAGLAFGIMFPIAITLPLDYARDGQDALRLTAGTLGIGYLISSTGSSLTGGLRDLTESFVPVFLVLAVVALLPVVAVLLMRRQPPGTPGAPAAQASTAAFP